MSTVRGAAEDLRTRPVPRLAPSLRVWRVPYQEQLLVSWRLRGSRQAEPRNRHSLVRHEVNFPVNSFLLSGNRSVRPSPASVGDPTSASVATSSNFVKQFRDVFKCFPVCSVIDENIFCMPGGLSPEIPTKVRRLVRPTDVPDTGLICDLL